MMKDVIFLFWAIIRPDFQGGGHYMKNFKKGDCNCHPDFRWNNLIQIHAKMESTAVHCTDAENVDRGTVEAHEITNILRQWFLTRNFKANSGKINWVENLVTVSIFFNNNGALIAPSKLAT